MKKTILRILVTCVVATMLLSMLTGCRQYTNELESPEFIFVSETVSILDGIGEIRDTAYFDNYLYIWTEYTEIIDDMIWETTVRLFSINIDGTNFTELPNFNPGESPFPNAFGNLLVTSFLLDYEGFIWVVEQGFFHSFDLPEDMDENDVDIWNYFVDLGKVTQIRKLDNTGAEILSVDIANIIEYDEWLRVDTFEVDSLGNMYIAFESTIFVLNSDITFQFQIDAYDWVNRLIRTPSGEIANLETTESKQVLRIIDIATEEWGETIELPLSVWNAFVGNDEYFLLYQRGLHLYGVKTETGESVRLLNLIESGISPDGLTTFILLADGQILCVSQAWDGLAFEQSFEISVLTKVPYTELPERTVITLATVGLFGSLRNYVVDFNRTNHSYRIHIIDYLDFMPDGEWDLEIAIARLSIDMIAGRIPDILDLSSLPFEQYVARGLLADLYPFIDMDSELSRSDLMETVFRAAEIGGSLYRVFSFFGINTLVGHPSVVGSEMGWTMDEFFTVLDSNPQADRPIGTWLTRNSFLQEAILVNISEYIDWVTGEAHFDTSEFAQLLEIAATFPEDFDGEMGSMDEQTNFIGERRQIMSNVGIFDFNDVLLQMYTFGGEIVFKGFPANSGNGSSLIVHSSLAITTQSPNQAAAWQFVRGTLMEDWQTTNVFTMFPTNRTAFERRAKEAIQESEHIDWGWGLNVWENRTLTQEDVDKVMTLIDSAYGVASADTSLMNIIMENAEDFFNGRNTAEETARIVQSRVSIYLSEIT